MLLLICVPLGVLLIASVFAYIPQYFANPKYDFVYSYCSGYGCEDTFYTMDGKIKQNQLEYNPYNKYRTVLRYYDVSEDSVRDVTQEEMSQLRLKSGSKSPDGYMLKRQSGRSSMFGSYEGGWYLENGLMKKHLSISSNSYDSNIDMIGWVQ